MNFLGGIQGLVSKQRAQPFFNFAFWQKHNLSPHFQIPDALWRYEKLLHLFLSSLKPITEETMYRGQLTLTVKDDWVQLWNRTRQLFKVSCSMKPFRGYTTIVTWERNCLMKFVKQI